MTKFLLSIITLLLSTAAFADPAFITGKKYHIVCTQFPDGCVSDGMTEGENTPVYYLTTATGDEQTFWIFTEEEDGYYSIRNASTGQYITYDGVRQDSPELRRYISMTDEMDGRNSLWYFNMQYEGIYAIRNAEHTNHLWDVRVDSYCVGTYSRTDPANSNQQFSLFDEDGNQVFEKVVTPVTPDGYDVSSWLVATTESPDGWSFEDDAWSDPGFGYYSNGTAVLASPFLEQWNESYYGPLPNNALQQSLRNLPPGNYVVSADIIAVMQAYNSGWFSISEETGYGVFLFANGKQTEAGTRNEKPEHYTTEFTVAANGNATLGVRIRDTNANWVAVDNFEIFFQGTEEELIAGEKAKIKAELDDYYAEDELNALIDACNDDFNELEVLRHTVDNMPTIDPLAKAVKNLTIDGQAAAWSESTNLYLASIPEENFGNDYTAVIDYELKDGWSKLTIGGDSIAPGDTYTFKKVTARKTYSFLVKSDDGKTTLTKKLTFTTLPVVRMYGSFNNDYSDGHIFVYEPTMGDAPVQLNMKAKWRGGITNGSGKHKRNYHVKLKDALGNKLEKKFFGLRNDNSWILESCQVDMSRVRNRVLTDLWNDYSTPPYYKALEKKAKTGTRGQFVELILNDEYRGIYCMTENMDRKQMQLVKTEETDDGEIETVHGQLWKSKDWSFAVFMGPNRGHYYPADYLTFPNENNDMWDKYQVKFPDFEDYGWQTDWGTLYDAVYFVCYADDDEFREQVADYFDIPVVMDYYILMETTLATDNHGKNQFFAVYDKQEDKKITFAVWDMDATCGQRWSDEYYHSDIMQPEQDYARYIYNNEHGENNLYKRLRDTDADDFNMKMRLRYRELRKNYLATDSILKRFKTYFDRFKLCGAAQREYNKWNGDSDIAGLDLNFDTEMTYLTNWFTRRMNYLDTVRFDIASLPEEEPEKLEGDVNGDGVVDVADISSIISVMAGTATAGASASDAADVNGDGVVDVADISSVISIMAGTK